MESERLSQPRQNDLSRPAATPLPTLAVTLSTKGAITPKEPGPGQPAPAWIVKFTVTYPAIPNTNTLQEPIIFKASSVTDVSRYRLQYLLNGEWRDASLGVGCMGGIDFYEESPSEINVAENYGTFRVLSPGEVWERSFSVFDLDWECPDENNTGHPGDAFRLQYLGGPLEWWDYGRREEHKETVVMVNMFGEVVGVKDNAGREELMLQRSNVLEASW
ncbi:hypothetical protein BJX68DRAFT_270834 [Aspergillus pseudodeflectus]|uniref:Uncharacterized protein n=1 Tax=Aspergillus pseudodeflectus TaxID=176178 RepID=A0ABR4JQ04_9EURO